MNGTDCVELETDLSHREDGKRIDIPELKLIHREMRDPTPANLRASQDLIASDAVIAAKAVAYDLLCEALAQGVEREFRLSHDQRTEMAARVRFATMKAVSGFGMAAAIDMNEQTLSAMGIESPSLTVGQIYERMKIEA